MASTRPSRQGSSARRGPVGGAATLLDVTSAYAVYGVMGPRSRELLSAISRSDFTDKAFPFGSSRTVDIGYATVRATRITYVGELGWELYVPAEFAVGVYEDLTTAGAGLGGVNAGYYAIESMRLEKAYRAYGRELSPDYNPVEAGLLFACKLKTGIPFLGREAVEKARADGPRRKLVSLVLDDPDVMMWGGELVLRDGLAAGQVTSAAWGEAVGSSVGLAYVRHSGGEVMTADLAEAPRSAWAATSARPPCTCGRRSIRPAGKSRTPDTPGRPGPERHAAGRAG